MRKTREGLSLCPFPNMFAHPPTKSSGKKPRTLLGMSMCRGLCQVPLPEFFREPRKYVRTTGYSYGFQPI